MSRYRRLHALAALAYAAPFVAAAQFDGPRTPWGHPDLQGLWTNATLTPLQRPPELAGKEFFTRDEIAEFEQDALRKRMRIGRLHREKWGPKTLSSSRESCGTGAGR